MTLQCATQIKTFTAVTIDVLPISLLKSLVHFQCCTRPDGKTAAVILQFSDTDVSYSTHK